MRFILSPQSQAPLRCLHFPQSFCHELSSQNVCLWLSVAGVSDHSIVVEQEGVGGGALGKVGVTAFLGGSRGGPTGARGSVGPE